MSQSVLAVTLALASMAAGCATASGDYYHLPCQSSGGCEKEDVVSAGIGLAVVALGMGGYYLLTRPSAGDSGTTNAAPRERALSGRVRWQDSPEAEVPPLPVTLQRSDGGVLPQTTTDKAGTFQFPFPRNPGWYTVAVKVEGAQGETTFWLQDRPPDALEIVLSKPAP